MLEKLKSRKLLVTIGTAVFVILNRALGLGIDEDTITKLIGLVTGYNVGQGIADVIGKGK